MLSLCLLQALMEIWAGECIPDLGWAMWICRCSRTPPFRSAQVAVPDRVFQSPEPNQPGHPERNRFFGYLHQSHGGADYDTGHHTQADSVWAETDLLISERTPGHAPSAILTTRSCDPDASEGVSEEFSSGSSRTRGRASLICRFAPLRKV
jgi:hypothetical protein